MWETFDGAWLAVLCSYASLLRRASIDCFFLSWKNEMYRNRKIIHKITNTFIRIRAIETHKWMKKKTSHVNSHSNTRTRTQLLTKKDHFLFHSVYSLNKRLFLCFAAVAVADGCLLLQFFSLLLTILAKEKCSLVQNPTVSVSVCDDCHVRSLCVSAFVCTKWESFFFCLLQTDKNERYKQITNTCEQHFMDLCASKKHFTWYSFNFFLFFVIVVVCFLSLVFVAKQPFSDFEHIFFLFFFTLLCLFISSFGFAFSLAYVHECLCICVFFSLKLHKLFVFIHNNNFSTFLTCIEMRWRYNTIAMTKQIKLTRKKKTKWYGSQYTIGVLEE